LHSKKPLCIPKSAHFAFPKSHANRDGSPTFLTPRNWNIPQMNPIEWLRDNGRRLVELKDTSHSIALGTAVGMFFGFMPLWGFKTLLALAVCRLFGANLLATAIAASLHDVALPILPLLLRWEYDIGFWLLSNPHTLPPKLSLSRDISHLVWFQWSTFLTVGRPLLVGSLVFSTPVAIATYYVVLTVVKRKQGDKVTGG
jgi:uncharacterized protein (DUF2062 family)